MSPAWLGRLRDRLRAPVREPEQDPALYADARRAESLLAAGRTGEAMRLYLSVFDRDPGLLVELGAELEEVAAGLGGDAWLDYRLAGLRAALDAASQDGDADLVREAYGELLEEHRGQPERLARIRAVGRLIDAAVERGDLPRALIRRAPR